ncbi:Uncharacterised protein [Prescottella equi]|uniref:Gp37-like protein n=1 Tax=Rhodococcus hoagii TaxID=43767 RepID=UPI000DFE4528|nr:hypothetical protein [Prescottella equi]SUE07145.1 Uncharacterised protein [Prescottella equi]
MGVDDRHHGWVDGERHHRRPFANPTPDPIWAQWMVQAATDARWTIPDYSFGDDRYRRATADANRRIVMPKLLAAEHLYVNTDEAAKHEQVRSNIDTQIYLRMNGTQFLYPIKSGQSEPSSRCPSPAHPRVSASSYDSSDRTHDHGVAAVTTVQTIDFDAVFEQITAKIKTEADERLTPPLIRIWDGDWNLRGICKREIGAEFSFIDNETGVGMLEMPADYFLSEWLAAADERPTSNVHVTMDKDGARWVAACPSCRSSTMSVAGACACCSNTTTRNLSTSSRGRTRSCRSGSSSRRCGCSSAGRAPRSRPRCT